MGYTKICDRLLIGERKGLKVPSKDEKRNFKRKFKTVEENFGLDLSTGTFENLVETENRINGAETDEYIDLAGFEYVSNGSKISLVDVFKNLSHTAKSKLSLFVPLLEEVRRYNQRLGNKQLLESEKNELGK